MVSSFRNYFFEKKLVFDMFMVKSMVGILSDFLDMVKVDSIWKFDKVFDLF